jgi:hypothetical protein
MTAAWIKNLGSDKPPERTGRFGRALDRPATRYALLTALVVAAALFTVGLVCLFQGQRAVMVDNGGFCASGGPYEIANGHQCSGAVVGLTIGGVFALIVGGLALVALSVALIGSRAVALGLVLWGALFGALGYNFIALGITNPSGGTAWGWLIPGVMFWLMALPGIPALLVLLGIYPPSSRQSGSATVLIVLAVGFAIGYVAAVAVVNAAA